MAMRTLWTVAPVARVLGRGGAASASTSARGGEHLARRDGTIDEDPFSVEAGAPRVGRVDAWRELGFSSAREMREHHGSDFHRHNRRRLRDGRAPVTEAEFEAMLRTNDLSDLSSISGSDDSDSDDARDDSGDESLATNSRAADERVSSSISRKEKETTNSNAKIVVEAEDGSRFGVWRCLAAPLSSSRDVDRVAALAALRDVRGGVDRDRPWVIILARGGHFAATAFDPTRFVTTKETKTLTDLVPVSAATSARKTFHRYVVRAKAGGRQSGADGGGKTIKSAGSSVRRANEAALERDIRALFHVDPVWKSTVVAASLIFVSASKTDERTLFSGADAPLSRDDARVRRVPFATKRPTFNETRRVVGKLALVSFDVCDEKVTIADEASEGASETRERLAEVVSEKKKEDESRRLTPAQAERLAAAKARAAEAAAALGELGMGDDMTQTGNTATAAEGEGSAPSLSKKEKEKLKKRRAKERAKQNAAEAPREAPPASGSAPSASDGNSRSGETQPPIAPGREPKGGKAAALLAKARQNQTAKRDEAVRGRLSRRARVLFFFFFLDYSPPAAARRDRRLDDSTTDHRPCTQDRRSPQRDGRRALTQRRGAPPRSWHRLTPGRSEPAGVPSRGGRLDRLVAFLKRPREVLDFAGRVALVVAAAVAAEGGRRRASRSKASRARRRNKK